MYIVPKRYDAATDQFVPVTQEWVDFVQRQFAAFGKAREASRSFLDAWRPEFEQKAKT